jgi:hypothetical protein
MPARRWASGSYPISEFSGTRSPSWTMVRPTQQCLPTHTCSRRIELSTSLDVAKRDHRLGVIACGGGLRWPRPPANSRHVTTWCQGACSRRARASQRSEPRPHSKLAFRRLRYPALPGQLRTRRPPDDVTFSGTTRRWEFNYQHRACIDWKQPEIKLRVEGLATNANCRYASSNARAILKVSPFCGDTFSMWPYICTNKFLELPDNGKETRLDARMDVDVYRDVAMGDC